jgi:hypothetical protein
MNPIASIFALAVGAWAALKLLGPSEDEPGPPGPEHRPPVVAAEVRSARSHGSARSSQPPPGPLTTPIRGLTPASPTRTESWEQRFQAPSPISSADRLAATLEDLQGLDPFSDPQGWSSELVVAWGTHRPGVDLDAMAKGNRIVLRSSPHDESSAARMLRLHLPEDPEFDKIVLSGPGGTLELRGGQDPGQLVAAWILFAGPTLADVEAARGAGDFGEPEDDDLDLAIPVEDLFTIQPLS